MKPHGFVLAEDANVLPICGVCGHPIWWAIHKTAEWDLRLARIRDKHEREGGPDEQQLADWGRSS